MGLVMAELEAKQKEANKVFEQLINSGQGGGPVSIAKQRLLDQMEDLDGPNGSMNYVL